MLDCAEVEQADATDPPIAADTALRDFQQGRQPVVRALSMTAMLAASMTARAEPATTALQIRLVVVEGCATAPGTTDPRPVPAQYSEAPALPAQVRELAPPTGDEGDPALPEPPTVYY